MLLHHCVPLESESQSALRVPTVVRGQVEVRTDAVFRLRERLLPQPPEGGCVCVRAASDEEKLLGVSGTEKVRLSCRKHAEPGGTAGLAL